MDLEFSIRISARQIPLETYNKIIKVISWQLKNESNTPFKEAEFCESLDGDPCPAFVYSDFCEHNSVRSHNEEASFFEILEEILISKFGFKTQEIRAIDLILSNACNNFNKINTNLDRVRSDFFIDSCNAKIIFDHHDGIDITYGHTCLW